MNIQPAISQILAVVYAALFFFGILYSLGVGWVMSQGYAEGYMGLIVALGVGLTLAPFTLLGPVNIWWVYGAFCASGAPMIVGSIWRHVSARKREQENERQAARMA